MPSEIPVGAEQFEHASGLSVIYRPNDAAPVVALQMWVRVGSGDESEHEAGLAHVHEHMLFKGTATRGVGEIARDVESVGGSINAWTSFDQTVYHIVVPSRFADQGLDVLLDAVANSAFDADELERELEVIQEEILRSEDIPRRSLSRMLFETAYTDHPYGRPVIGTNESVAAFTRDDILSFYRRWYQPRNMNLVVVGDVERGQVDAALDRHFRAQRDEGEIARSARVVEPPQTSLRVSTEFRDIQDGHVAIAFHVPDLAHEDTPALELLAILLGQGESSILFENVQRRSGLTNEIYSYLYSPAEPGIFMVGG
jgi:zinc protease